MRTRTIVIGALLLGSAALAQAQDQQQQTTPQAPSVAQQTATPASSFVPKWGQVDFGYRGNSLAGDEARYNRFRDLRDGGYVSRFKVSKETEKTIFYGEANNVGYRDQRYVAAFESIGKLKANFEWNQVPLFLSNYGSTLFTERGSYLDVNDGIQAAIQATGTNTTARNAALANAMAGASAFDLRSRRDIGSFNMVYTFNRDVDFKLNIQNTRRNGNQVMSYGFGTSPGLSPSVELGVPLDDRTTDVKGAIEFANAKGLLSFGYDASWFDNSIPLVQFDNPLRSTDIAGGASIGQAAWWPGNSAFSVNVNGGYKLAKRTRATAALSMGRWEQDEALPPPTINTALVAPSLMRSTAAARADITSAVFNLSSRPVPNVWLNAKYRYYDYANKTARFEFGDPSGKLALLPIGDWALTTQYHENEPASFKRKTLDLDASFTPFDYVAFGAGYGREDADRTWRIFEKTADDVFRVTMDSTGNQYFTLRAKYEYSRREGEGFDQSLLDEVGEQPGMRHYDIANRKRARFSTSVSVNPVPALSLNAGVGTGNDDYDDSGFGLRDNDNTNWSTGLDFVPNEIVSFSASYGYEKMKANQYSRTANPLSATDVTFNDPTRDWWLDQEDIVRTMNANLELTKLFPKTDIRLGYDLSDGEATYVYNMKPEQKVFTTTPLTQLPELKNRLTTGRFDIQHFVRPNVALGVVYRYEEYKVEDFALSTDTINRLDPYNGNTGAFASTIYAGYLFRPYTAHTWFLKMSYLW